MAKPRVFIGSAKDSLNVAYAVQHNLQSELEVTVWDRGVFQLSAAAIDSLAAMSVTCDFAIFVFCPSDILELGKDQFSAVRDNVLFELGLFIGVLGRERCFILTPAESKDLRIPSDLVGVTRAIYHAERSDGEMRAATGPCCHEINTVARKLGARSNRVKLHPPSGGSDLGAPNLEEENAQTEITASDTGRDAKVWTGKKPGKPMTQRLRSNCSKFALTMRRARLIRQI